MDQPKKDLKISGEFVKYFLIGTGILFWILGILFWIRTILTKLNL